MKIEVLNIKVKNMTDEDKPLLLDLLPESAQCCITHSVKIEPEEEGTNLGTARHVDNFHTCIKIKEFNINIENLYDRSLQDPLIGLGYGYDLKYHDDLDIDPLHSVKMEPVEKGTNLRSGQHINDLHTAITIKDLNIKVENINEEDNPLLQDPLAGYDLNQSHELDTDPLQMEPQDEGTGLRTDEDVSSLHTNIKICESDTKVENINDDDEEYYIEHDGQIKNNTKNGREDVEHMNSPDESTNSLHKQSHTDQRLYQCSVCNERFTTSSNLSTHSCFLTNNKSHTYDVCNQKFTYSSDLNRHKRTHTNEKPYVCVVCNKGFSESSSFKAHKRNHTNVRLHVCDVCNKGFTQSSNLIKHRRIHTNERPYVCDVCNKGFTQLPNLIKHRRIHTNERPYVCDVCNKGFTDSSHLNSHKQTHTGEKAYVCDVCSKSFTQSSSLKKHKRIHTNERPYVCDICNKGFTDSSSVNRHKRTHTNDKLYV